MRGKESPDVLHGLTSLTRSNVSERYLYIFLHIFLLLQNIQIFIFYINIFVNVLMCSECVVSQPSPCCLGYQYYDDCSGDWWVHLSYFSASSGHSITCNTTTRHHNTLPLSPSRALMSAFKVRIPSVIQYIAGCAQHSKNKPPSIKVSSDKV